MARGQGRESESWYPLILRTLPFVLRISWLQGRKHALWFHIKISEEVQLGEMLTSMH